MTELQDQDILTILEALSFHSKSLKWLKLRSIENVQFREDVVIDPQILSKYNIYVSKLIHLEHLDLSDFAHLSDDLMITIGKNCKQLTYLNVSGKLKIEGVNCYFVKTNLVKFPGISEL